VPTHLTTQAESWNGVEIVFAAGEIDLSTAPRLGQALEAALTPGASSVADLSRVDFIDSAGTHTLALADRAAAAHGGRLLIVASEAVSHVLAVTGLDRAFQVYDELREALAAAGGEGHPVHANGDADPA
jgi:anti-sigma B factor antagonist